MESRKRLKDNSKTVIRNMKDRALGGLRTSSQGHEFEPHPGCEAYFEKNKKRNMKSSESIRD